MKYLLMAVIAFDGKAPETMWQMFDSLEQANERKRILVRDQAYRRLIDAVIMEVKVVG